MRPRTAVATCVLALCVAALTCGPAAVSSAAGADQWDAPEKVSAYAFAVAGLTASSAGTAYYGWSSQTSEQKVIWRAAGASADTVVNGDQVRVSGTSLIYRSGSVLHYVDFQSGALGTSPGEVMANVGGAALDTAMGSKLQFVLHHPSGPDTTLPRLAFAGDRTTAVAAADDGTGWAFVISDLNRTHYDLYWYDLAAQTARLLTSRNGGVPYLQVTPQSVWWEDDGAVFRVPRGGGPVVEVHAPSGTATFSATDDAIAFDVNRTLVIRTVTGDQTVDLPSVTGVTTDGSTFIVATSSGVATKSIYRVDSRGTSTHMMDAPLATYTMWPITMTLGRVYYEDDGMTPVRWLTRTVVDPGMLVVGAEQAAPAALPEGKMIAADGDRLAYNARVDGANFVVVLRNGKEERRIAVPTGAYLKLSGSRLLMTGFSNDWGRLVNVRSGSAMKVAPTADIWGPILVWTDDQRRLWRRDIRRRVSANNPIQVDATRHLHSQPKVWGNWMTWVTGVSGIQVFNIRTGEMFKVSGQKEQLTDGTLSWFRSNGPEPGPGNSALIDLRGHTRTPILLPSDDYVTDVVEDTYAYQDLTHRLLHIAPLPFRASGRARTLYLNKKQTFRPGSNRRWWVELDATKSLSSWRMVLRGPYGRVVRRWHGGQADGGEIRANWDGRRSTGRLARSGTYTLTVSAWAQDGSGALCATGTCAQPSTRVVVQR